MFYRLILNGRESVLIDGDMFYKWVREQGERIALNVLGRTEQLKRYTNLDVLDWEMED
jgi:hypothetical protein